MSVSSQNCQPILSIVGPTATGKTSFALKVAESLSDGTSYCSVDIISADSRQVYKGMEIGTGVDLPAEFVVQKSPKFPFPFFQKNSIRVHGLAVVHPNEEWSVAHFQKMAQQILDAAREENSLVILVGGTGLYHRQLFQEDPDLLVQPNEEVRNLAITMSVAELQNWLKKVDEKKWTKMNTSDQQNPRRLVRAIELAVAHEKNAPQNSVPLPKSAKFSHLTIGLTDTNENIATKIRQRVDDRLVQGFLNEVQKLIADYSDEIWKGPAFSATGYKEARQFLEGNLTEEQMKELWARRETQYAKRQKTWWKKYGQATWYEVGTNEVGEADWQRSARTQVLSWLTAHKPCILEQ